MDYKLSTIIKKEKEEILEDSFPKLSFDVEIKVETDPDIDDWCTQKISTDYQKSRIYVKLEKDDPQTCAVCNKYFSDSYSLYKHNLIHLTVPLIKLKLFTYDACPKFYMKKELLENHKLTDHQSKKQNKGVMDVTSQRTCQICNKTYSYKIWLEHMRNIHGVGQWKCVSCDNVFKCEKYLKRHVMFKHTDLGIKSERIRMPQISL